MGITIRQAHGHGKILGSGIVGTHAGDMIGEIALAIEMGADAVDIGKTIPVIPAKAGTHAARERLSACEEKPDRCEPVGLFA